MKLLKIDRLSTHNIHKTRYKGLLSEKDKKENGESSGFEILHYLISIN